MALAGQGKTKATVGYLDIQTTGNQSLAAIVPVEIEGKFLYWWLSSQYLTLRNLSSQDGRDGLNLEMIGNIVCPVPPRKTQRRIARFLDEKTARIDALIEKNRELLNRLAEKRQTLITHAVTKGLRPDVPMKPSGIDWLGDIPAHWEMLPLRRVSRRVATGRTPASANADYFADGVLNWFTPGDFSTSIELHESTRKLTPRTIRDGVCTLYPAGTVFLVGIGATLGKVAVSTTAGSANQQINTILPNKNNDPYFMAYFLHGFRAVVRTISNSNTLGILNQDGTKSLVVLVPPISEQKEVASELRDYDSRGAGVIEKIERSIELLQEYRAALITAAVTGQIEELV
ncbi:MAG: restriction endonuclease subunit S [Boseongicola sp. SB0673_bin_14]|nr:restriction endonuclease subunit S [Boseongicola sp. SB0673_bin_14]